VTIQNTFSVTFLYTTEYGGIFPTLWHYVGGIMFRGHFVRFHIADTLHL